MDVDEMGRLRSYLDAVVRLALKDGELSLSGEFNFSTGRIQALEHGADLAPPLDSQRILALNVLVGDPATLPQALADYLLDVGHEYAKECYEKGRAEGRERCEELSRRLRIVSDRLDYYETLVPEQSAIAVAVGVHRVRESRWASIVGPPMPPSTTDTPTPTEG